uniref:Uncharacterized protein n=1 Tax=Zea mays TaxID=4577 RepID=B6SQY4_MAIZE|nr:hypothetical protein [Zea mays]
MDTAVDRHLDDIAPPVQKRRGWVKRMHSSVPAVAGEGTAAAAAAEDGGATRTKPRRGGWLRRLLPAPWERALGRRPRKLGGGGGGGAAAGRLLAGLPRWKRVSVSVGGRGCTAALLDAAAFRVLYVVEAVVLGLALSCFYCCCGCQI